MIFALVGFLCIAVALDYCFVNFRENGLERIIGRRMRRNSHHRKTARLL